jgi:hypothetical protein
MQPGMDDCEKVETYHDSEPYSFVRVSAEKEKRGGERNVNEYEGTAGGRVGHSAK